MTSIPFVLCIHLFYLSYMLIYSMYPNCAIYAIYAIFTYMGKQLACGMFIQIPTHYQMYSHEVPISDARLKVRFC